VVLLPGGAGDLKELSDNRRLSLLGPGLCWGLFSHTTKAELTSLPRLQLGAVRASYVFWKVTQLLCRTCATVTSRPSFPSVRAPSNFLKIYDSC
jgi:hypothetical protein